MIASTKKLTDPASMLQFYALEISQSSARPFAKKHIRQNLLLDELYLLSE